MKIILPIICCLSVLQSHGQHELPVSVRLFAGYSRTLYDYTYGNNPWGIGLGFAATGKTNSKIQPLIELTADAYLEDDKVLRSNPDGSLPGTDNTVSSTLNVFAGTSIYLSKKAYVSLTAGPSFISGQTLLGVKPSIGYNFSASGCWTAKMSYTNIFNRTVAKEDFGTLAVSLGIKLF